MSMAGKTLNGLIRLYQVAVSPYLGANCRFHPTCSCFAHEAIASHGAVMGGFMALRRIARCHPWGGSGYDPVPAKQRLSAEPGS